MFKHAQLNENGVVVGISWLSGIVEEANMVCLDGSRENDGKVELGWRYAEGLWHMPEGAEKEDWWA